MIWQLKKSSVDKVDEKYREIVVSALGAFSKKHEVFAAQLAGDAAEIVEKIAEINEKYVPMVFKNVSKIVEATYFGYWDAVELVRNFTKEYAEVLDKITEIDEKHIPVVLDAVDKIVEKDAYLGYRVLMNSPNLLKKMDSSKEITTDKFLIESIRDQKDAQWISQVIDMKKYQDQYNEKVAGFY